MSGKIRLFAKGENGLLSEIQQADGDAARIGRRISRVSLAIDVLWTAEEEAARDAEEAAQAAERNRRQSENNTKREQALSKLSGLGLTPEDIKNALS